MDSVDIKKTVKESLVIYEEAIQSTREKLHTLVADRDALKKVKDGPALVRFQNDIRKRNKRLEGEKRAREIITPSTKIDVVN